MQNFDQQELASEVDDLPGSSELAGILFQHRGNYSGKRELDKEQTPTDSEGLSGWGQFFTKWLGSPQRRQVLV